MAANRRGINQQFIERIKSANGIVSVAGRYMQVKQKGKTHWACCPFHHEKTPSFAINDMGQFYKCFGCGVSGDVITLVQQLESLDFYGAVEFLARVAGIEMPEEILDEEYANNVKKKRRILQALELAREYYCKSLYKDSGKKYLEYLHGRGINDELIKLFNIGLCADWNGAVAYLRGKNFTEDEIIGAGIGARSAKGNAYDVMAERITFAIFNVYGDCIGFTGRTISDDKEVAKYRNTSQTMVFDKGSIVYGIDVLKKNKRENFVDKLIVVEGNVDVIALVGAGFTNTVACMGTSLTPFHAKVFKRFTDKIYIAFDGDAAGQKATIRGLGVLENENLDVRVVSFPVDTDPDDYLRKHGRDGFEKLLDDALPLIDYRLEYLKKTMPVKDNLDKSKFLKSAVEVLKPLAGSAELELYIPRVAEIVGVSFDAISREIGGAQRKKEVESEIKAAFEPLRAYAKALNFVVASILHGKGFANFNVFVENDIQIQNRLYKRLVDKIAEYAESSKTWRVSCVFDEFDEGEIAQLDALINFPINEKEGIAKYYTDCVQYLVKYMLKSRVEELKERYKQADDTQEKKQIMAEIGSINKRIKK